VTAPLAEAAGNPGLAALLAAGASGAEVVAALVADGALVGVEPGGEPLRLRLRQAGDGDLALLVFSTAAAALAESADPALVEARADVLLDMGEATGASTLLVDAAGPAPAAVPLAAVREALASEGRVLARDTPVLVADPGPLPAEVTDAARRVAGELPGVTGAWLVLVDEGGGPARLVLAVRGGGPDVAREAAARLGPLLPPRLPVDVLVDAEGFDDVVPSLLDPTRGA
jgi:hypothetical protein